MPASKAKRPNALKHGAFTKTAILRGEDPREFEDLHSALVKEWNPIGPTEEDAVLSIAKCVWRKRRVQHFLEAEVWTSEMNPQHPAFNEAVSLQLVAAIIEKTPDESLEWYTSVLARFLAAKRIDKLEQKFPQENFGSASEWAQAVKDEITSFLLPDLGEAPKELLLKFSAATVSQDLFKHELALDERLDAMIDRAIKRLIQTKAMKQMLGHASGTGGDDQAKKIQNGRAGGSAKIINHEALPDE
jgi:hypothetical protein